ncbi:MAG: acetyl-CoA carboxylase biotin carboxyl carrier protein subunit [Tenuifilum sp.]|jgi:biotin carboxyl carrier protein|uniref:biotin/lipoyl-containing protein n=1 Tax=Tenuifilum TaxID=2760873 RepID=UPI0019AD61AD|nr:acetyl-CoA carboxylase biotin carboxyl carrier protein subunit [Bacteroidales bacterium]HOK61727.1 acetyl-CoA carboxylase biotin carboxyl carrier protein subunit [Tenuifilum sp.]MBP7169117.1 acetyl-CoA carboxylase biotin carboxyl carrier protein subunit [Bacteroidales bacterium]MBP8960406.1 acetyl-CoA carboxylase biotin carboxyl carrier protein subunit [Bacteroidales bacterium]HOK84856.1 acetyl-CoA carboxylase biotin carboxyl carrier protein subunit [Tenuifilum sp.]
MIHPKLDDKNVTAFIPGTIIDVKVKKGQEVKQGDVLVILDAMKMHNRLIAPSAGKVKEVKVKPGDRVSKGALLVSIE